MKLDTNIEIRHSFSRKGLVVLACLVVWYLVSKMQIINPFFFPDPIVTLRRLGTLLGEISIWKDVLSTFRRILISFIIASGAGISLGFILGLSEKMYRNIEPTIEFLRSVTPLSIFPLFLIILGIGDSSKIGVAAWSGALLILFNTTYSMINSRKSRILVAQVMGGGTRDIFRHVIIYESLPQIIVGLRTAMSWIIAVIIATEMFVGTSIGLGHRILDFQIMYDIPAVYASILLCGIMGYIINLIFVMIEKKWVHWKGK